LQTNQDNHQEVKPVKKDQPGLALFAINCYALGTAAASIFFKRAMANGASLLDFFLCRNISMLIVAGFAVKM